MQKLDKLTPEQEAKLEVYRDEGIRIGLATGAELDEELVRSLTDKHRIACGLQAATKFIVYDSPFEAIKNVKGITPSNALYGQHDINWLITAEFYKKECGLDIRGTEYLFELSKLVGWMWMSSTTTIITRRPTDIHLIDRRGIKVLHNTEGLALEYMDGTGVYAINGVRIPAKESWIVTTPAEKLDPKKILALDNEELKSIALAKVGAERAFSALKKEKLHEAKLPKGGHYILYKFPDISEKVPFLFGKCPSSAKPFVEEVHPDCKSVAHALTWRETGEIGDGTYEEPEIRT